ncbi:MAG: GNAT family N-acetyltransferase [Planctomycetales bacterium]
MELTAQGIHITRQKRVCNSLRIDNYETMLAGFSENFRNNLRRARNKLDQTVDVRFEWTQDVAGLESAYERFLSVEAAGWKGEQGTSISQGSHRPEILQ